MLIREIWRERFYYPLELSIYLVSYMFEEKEEKPLEEEERKEPTEEASMVDAPLIEEKLEEPIEEPVEKKPSEERPAKKKPWWKFW